MGTVIWSSLLLFVSLGTQLVYSDDTCGKRPLVHDEAWLTINNSLDQAVNIYTRNQECWKCPLVFVTSLENNVTCTLIINTMYGTDMEIRLSGSEDNVVCNFSEKFVENGDYVTSLPEIDGSRCLVELLNDPMTAEMPILYAGCGIVILWIVVKIMAYLHRRREAARPKKEMDHEMAPESNGIIMSTLDSTKPVNTKRKERLKSLDAFRGLSLIIMVFVNYGGGGYWFFEHLPWNGLTLADLVFPWFVFIMGTSMNFSFRGMLKRGKTRFWILWKVIRRTAILFLFGIMLNTNWGPVELSKVRIPGVLQRLALCYLVVALLETVFARATDTAKDKSWSWIRDVAMYLPEWLLALCILAAYITLTYTLPVPGCPTGYTGPGGLHEDRKYENCTGGAGGYIDQIVLGVDHLYANPTPKEIYQTNIPYDPEGILGTLSAAFLCFLGLQAGRIFLLYKDHKGRIIRLIVWALITGAIGTGLCGGTKNEGIVPINKNIWSVSFTFVTAGLGYLLLCIMYIVVDVVKSWDGEPFIYPGMNPLIIYLCHSLFYRMFPINWVMEAIHWKLLLRAIWDVILYLGLAFVLYRKKIFLSI